MKTTRRNRSVFPAVALAISAALLTACDAGNGSDTAAPAETSSTPTVSPGETSAEEESTDVEASNSTAHREMKDKNDEASKSPKAPVDETGRKVPNVVGMNHAEAMTKLHAAGFMVNEEDASAEGRWILDNSNWKVCRQNPGPGEHPSTLRVAIYSVKLDESC